MILSSCISSQLPRVVDVPISAKVPPIYVPPKPDLPLQFLKSTSTDAQIIKAYVVSVEMLANDDNILRDQLFVLLQSS